jgi:hypothetical protein
MTGEWRKLHNEKLHGLYSSPTIVRVIKSRRMRWAENLARMDEGRDVCRVLVGKLDGNRYWRDPDVDGKIILIWIFRKWHVGVWTEVSWLRRVTVGGHL